MTDTITSTGIPPTPSTFLGGGYSAISSGFAAQGPNEGQLFLQVTLPYYQSPKVAQGCAAWISKYMDTHDLKDPKTMQVVASNVATFCYADTRLVKQPKMSNYDAIHTGPGAGNFNYNTQSVNELSGTAMSSIAAWAHYMWGDGKERFVKLENIGLRIQPNQIAPVMNIVNSGRVGTFQIAENFSRNTMLDGIIPASYLGNVTLKTEGKLTIQSSGAWTYNGVVRGYNDIYDANPSTFRGPIGEFSTKVLDYTKGKPYQISMPGQIAVKGTGFR